MNETVSVCQKISHETQRMREQVESWRIDVDRRNLQAIPIIKRSPLLKAEANLLETTLRQYQSWFVSAADEARKITSAAAEKVGFGAADEELVDFKSQIRLLERHAKTLYGQAETLYQTAMTLREGK